MIFTGALFDAIVVERTKTVTRRRAFDKAGRRFRPPAPGDVLPLQRGYVKATASALVVDVRREPAFSPDPLDDAEARREGFHDAAKFCAAWRDIYGDEPCDVWRIELGEVAQEGGKA